MHGSNFPPKIANPQDYYLFGRGPLGTTKRACCFGKLTKKFCITIYLGYMLLVKLLVIYVCILNKKNKRNFLI